MYLVCHLHLLPHAVVLYLLGMFWLRPPANPFVIPFAFTWVFCLFPSLFGLQIIWSQLYFCGPQFSVTEASSPTVITFYSCGCHQAHSTDPKHVAHLSLSLHQWWCSGKCLFLCAWSLYYKPTFLKSSFFFFNLFSIAYFVLEISFFPLGASLLLISSALVGLALSHALVPEPKEELCSPK